MRICGDFPKAGLPHLDETQTVRREESVIIVRAVHAVRSPIVPTFVHRASQEALRALDSGV